MDGLEESFFSGSPIEDPVPRRLVSANFDNTSRIQDFGSVCIFGHDANDYTEWTDVAEKAGMTASSAGGR